MVAYPNAPKSKEHIVLIGGGWAAFYLAEHLSYAKYTITMLSPRRACAYTPLLASAAIGIFSFSLAEESIRSKSRSQLRFHKANAVAIDFSRKTVRCAPAFDENASLSSDEFDVEYDYLVIAPGCLPNTFGTPGVDEHAIFVKNVSDAMRIRKKLFDLLEHASLPHIPEARVKELLHIAIVGGGPTGIELCAELDDLAAHELRQLYPDVAEHTTITVYDVAPNILGAYDRKLHEYATTQLDKRNIKVATNTHIQSVDAHALHIKCQAPVPYGMLLWATGNKNVPLVDAISADVRLPERGLRRIQTDSRLRVYRAGSGDDAIHEAVFALGDAADIPDVSLPTTAEVAVQKAKYLVEQLNGSTPQPFGHPFEYSQKAMVSYIGSHDGVITGDSSRGQEGDGWTGQAAWLAWRRGSLYWNRNLRSRVTIVISWALNWIFGKEIAKL